MPAGRRRPSPTPGRNAAATPAADDAVVASSVDPSDTPSSAPVEMRLVVWLGPGPVWRACISGPGLDEREFASPFELARFVAWPLGPPVRGGGRGLR